MSNNPSANEAKEFEDMKAKVIDAFNTFKMGTEVILGITGLTNDEMVDEFCSQIKRILKERKL